MTSSELKKMRRKQRKAELKAQAKVQEEKKGYYHNNGISLARGIISFKIVSVSYAIPYSGLF